ncbi:MAG: hypothetical protein JWM44_395 [Bacilli bacterium]|nr:hypothetical protein [Bacilli bacterium]
MRRGSDETKLEKNFIFNAVRRSPISLYLRNSTIKLSLNLTIKALICTLLLSILLPLQVFAHAILTNASPALNSQLDRSPSQIELTFNERLQIDLYRIEVFNAKGEPICCEKAKISPDQRQIQLKLPVLQQGHYTVTYTVISADGHPIQATYVFTIGNEPPAAPTTPEKPEASLHTGHSASGPEGFWAYRMFYFLSLLLVTGWAFWSRWIPYKNEEAKQKFKRIAHYIQFFYLISLVGFIIYQFSSYILGWTFTELVQLLPHTITGVSWIASLTLSVIGFPLLFRWRSFDIAWALLVLFSKSINGHAAATDLPWFTITFDFIHLIAAAVWVAGLTYLFIFRKEGAELFLPRFSKAALSSIVLLVITGSLFTLTILPSLNLLFDTTWGILLLCKIALVLCVICTGALLRAMMKKQSQTGIHRWLNLDLQLMLGIVIIASIFSYLNPLPSNDPLQWKATVGGIAMTTEISPMQPGKNQFSVELECPISLKQPKSVELWLTFHGKQEIAPIAVPLQQVANAPANTTESKLYAYSAVGPYLPFSGNWTAEVKVMDQDDNENVFSKKLRIY